MILKGHIFLRAEIIRCSDWSVAATIDGNYKDMFFSPLDNYFIVWEMFAITKESLQVSPICLCTLFTNQMVSK